MIALSLLPLVGMSVFSYWIGRGKIQERIRLSLGKMAQDIADKIDLTLRGKKQEIHSMASTYPLISRAMSSQGKTGYDLAPLLNNYCLSSDVYDALIVLDGAGNIIGINTVNRDGVLLPARPWPPVLPPGRR